MVSSDERGDGLSVRELYAGCIYLCLTLMAWVTGGLIGVLLMNLGFWIGAVDIGWVDDLFEGRGETLEVDPEDEGTTPDQLPQAPPLPVREAA